MEFDESKVYTLVNADKVKLGSKGYFADSLKELKIAVEQEHSDNYGEVTEIDDDSYINRFKIGNYLFGLFYLVYRPYYNTSEMFAHFFKCFGSIQSEYKYKYKRNYPFIHVKNRNNKQEYWIMNCDGENNLVYVFNHSAYIYFEIDLPTLFKNFTYLDGTPCGIEEK